MELFELFCILYIAAICTAQDNAGNELPRPTLELQTRWPAVFLSERVELSCKLPDAAGWTFSWYRDGQPVSSDSQTEAGSIFTISQATATHSGGYACAAHHKASNNNTEHSNAIHITVDEIPVPSAALGTPWSVVFTSQSVELSCGMKVRPEDWTYTWYRGQEVKLGPGVSVGSDGSSLRIGSAKPEHAGQYTCTGQHKHRPVQSKPSSAVSIEVNEIPVPSAALGTPWSVVFTSQSVELSCGMRVRPDQWTYTWYRGQEEVKQGPGVSLGSDGSSLTIGSAKPEHAEQYTCKGEHKHRPVRSEESNALSIEVKEIPVPLAALGTPWSVVFTSQSVELSCGMRVRPDQWTYTWYRGQEEVKQGPGVSLGSDGSSLTIGSAKPEHAEQYTCKGEHKHRPVRSEQSNALSIEVKEIPVPLAALGTPWSVVFTSQSLELSCGMKVRPDQWTYTWYRGQEEVKQGPGVSLGSDGSSLTIGSAKPEHAEQYTCKGEHKHRPVRSEESNALSIEVKEIPVPLVAYRTQQPTVFTSESVELSCGMEVSPDQWTYTWYRGQEEVKLGPGVSVGSDGSSLRIGSAKPGHAGQYTCTGKHKQRTVQSKPSSAVSIEVNEIPVPSAALRTPWSVVFTSQSVELSCGMKVSPEDWTYTWYRGQEVKLGLEVSVGSDGSSLRISSAKPEHAGQYTCTGQHKHRPVKSKHSNAVSIEVKDLPKPTLELTTSWTDVFATENVVLNCRVEGSTEWVFTWYRGAAEIQADPAVLAAGGTTFTISSASKEHAGEYMCRGRHKPRSVTTKNSDRITLKVYDLPKPTIELSTSWADVFPTENVVLNCRVEGSTEWVFTWYRGAAEIQADPAVLAAGGTTFIISSASKEHAGEYRCRGRHKPRSVTTKKSDRITLKVYDEIPAPGLKREPGHGTMYPEESVNFSCEVQSSSGWEYLWFKDGAKLEKKGAHYPIDSTALKASGVYQCRATRGQTSPFLTNFSAPLRLDVKARPWATVTLLTGWSEVFSTDRLDLKCEVHGSEVQWNYTWMRGEVMLPDNDHRIFTPGEGLDDGKYFCQGVRISRPMYSTRSDPFKTNNILLKRRVLLSISGCILFGIIAVFIGCVVMRFTRKPVEVHEKLEEPNLFLTMAELKASDVAHCPMSEYITEEELADLSKGGEDKDPVFNESTPLSIETSETADTAVNRGLSSFTY